MALRRMALALGVGYVLGARAGEKRYDELKDLWERLTGSPILRRAGDLGRELADRGIDSVSGWSSRVARGTDEDVQEEDEPDEDDDDREEARRREAPRAADDEEDRGDGGRDQADEDRSDEGPGQEEKAPPPSQASFRSSSQGSRRNPRQRDQRKKPERPRRRDEGSEGDGVVDGARRFLAAALERGRVA